MTGRAGRASSARRVSLLEDLPRAWQLALALVGIVVVSSSTTAAGLRAVDNQRKLPSRVSALESRALRDDSLHAGLVASDSVTKAQVSFIACMVQARGGDEAEVGCLRAYAPVNTNPREVR